MVSGRRRERNGGAIGVGPGSRTVRRSGSFRIEEHDVAGSAMGGDPARGFVALGDSKGRPDFGRAPLPYG